MSSPTLPWVQSPKGRRLLSFPGKDSANEASEVALVVSNLPANTGDVRDTGSIPGSGRSLEEGTATHFSIIAWRIPWTEEPGRLQSMGSQQSDTTQWLKCSQSLVEKFTEIQIVGSLGGGETKGAKHHWQGLSERNYSRVLFSSLSDLG